MQITTVHYSECQQLSRKNLIVRTETVQFLIMLILGNNFSKFVCFSYFDCIVTSYAGPRGIFKEFCFVTYEF